MLKDKVIGVGVCGGIAAYKVVEVVSRLKKLNAEVFVVMTENATNFITPLTFQSISGNKVAIDMFNQPSNWNIAHISLAKKADIFLIASATANIIGKIANGIADDLLTSTIMATTSKVIFAPAMNDAMYNNSIVQSNISKLRSLGYFFIDPIEGNMACGTYGKGCLASPYDIVQKTLNIFLGTELTMKGRRVLITAGPTREPIDPIRYLTNRSSGKMGYSIADEAYKRGANVTIVSGPVALEKPSGIEIIYINTAEEMYNQVMRIYEDFDILIMSAAVSDYKCKAIADYKIKKKNNMLSINFMPNPDIAKELGNVKNNRILVGFSAETDNVIENAKSKLYLKNFDMIIANDVTEEGSGFDVNTNIVKILKRDSEIISLGIMPKGQVAKRILDEIMNLESAETYC